MSAQSKPADRKHTAAQGRRSASWTSPRSFRAIFPNGIKVATVTSHWLNGESHTFERTGSGPGMVLVDEDRSSISFQLNPAGPADSGPFQVVIREGTGTWFLKADWWDDPAERLVRVFGREFRCSSLVVTGEIQIYLQLERRLHLPVDGDENLYRSDR